MIVTQNDMQRAFDELNSKENEIRKTISEPLAKIKEARTRLLKDYYKTVMIDRKKRPLNIGDRFEIAGVTYVVDELYMQILFGQLMFNTRITAYRVNKDGSICQTKKEFTTTEIQTSTLINKDNKSV